MWWQKCRAVKTVLLTVEDSDVGVRVEPEVLSLLFIPSRGEVRRWNCFFTALDRNSAKIQKEKSSQMTLQRTKGLPSDRPRPDGFPTWAVKP